MKSAFAATMIRQRYFADSFVAQLVSVSAFSHGLDPEPTCSHLGGSAGRCRKSPFGVAVRAPVPRLWGPPSPRSRGGSRLWRSPGPWIHLPPVPRQPWSPAHPDTEVGALHGFQVSQSRQALYVINEEDQETVDVTLIGVKGMG